MCNDPVTLRKKIHNERFSVPREIASHHSMFYSATDFGAGELMNRLSPKGSESPVSTEAAKPKLNKYGKPKKNVRWVVEERLVAIKYFEIDENERGEDAEDKREEFRLEMLCFLWLCLAQAVFTTTVLCRARLLIATSQCKC